MWYRNKCRWFHLWFRREASFLFIGMLILQRWLAKISKDSRIIIKEPIAVIQIRLAMLFQLRDTLSVILFSLIGFLFLYKLHSRWYRYLRHVSPFSSYLLLLNIWISLNFIWSKVITRMSKWCVRIRDWRLYRFQHIWIYLLL